ncbi:MAG: hypothetical protein ABL952_07655 [Pyrinomonadaceae bacterium]
MDERLYLDIAERYGDCASWAVWADVGLTPKSNVGDLSIFDHRKNLRLFDELNPNCVVVGLNIARPFDGIFANFHDGKPKSQDYKLRYAFNNTRFYGAYMTDIIKYLECTDSNQVMSQLRANPSIEEENVAIFSQELVDIKATNPLLIALGNHVFTILKRNFGRQFRIVAVTHYSHYINVDVYRNEIARVSDQL